MINCTTGGKVAGQATRVLTVHSPGLPGLPAQASLSFSPFSFSFSLFTHLAAGLQVSTAHQAMLQQITAAQHKGGRGSSRGPSCVGKLLSRAGGCQASSISRQQLARSSRTATAAAPTQQQQHMAAERISSCHVHLTGHAWSFKSNSIICFNCFWKF